MNMKNQKGFATIEIIFLIVIISVLSAVAVPKISKIIEKVSLDYEVKKFYSELRFAQTINRSATFKQKVFSKPVPNDQPVIFRVYNSKSYRLERNGILVRPSHQMSRNISLERSNSMKDIYFDTNGVHDKSGSVKIKSNVGTVKIVFDSVGRWRGVWESHD